MLVVKCSIFVLGADITCPLCRSLVVSNQHHMCSQDDDKSLPQRLVQPHPPNSVRPAFDRRKRNAAQGSDPLSLNATAS